MANCNNCLHLLLSLSSAIDQHFVTKRVVKSRNSPQTSHWFLVCACVENQWQKIGADITHHVQVSDYYSRGTRTWKKRHWRVSDKP